MTALSRLIRATPEAVSKVEDASLRHLEAQSLWQAVRRLSLADQEVVYLRYFLALPEADMAAALGVAPGTVKSRLHRALDRLRTIVEREFPLLGEGRD